MWGPYVKFGIIFLALHNVFYHLHIYNDIYGSYTGKTSTIYELEDYVLQLQRILRMVGTEQLLGGYWFLPTLLYASIIAYLIIRYIHNRILGGEFYLRLFLHFYF